METIQIKNVFIGEWEELNLGELPVTNFETAIDIVRASGFKNISLKQGDREWDNL